jgi:hypothetical protein
MVVTKSIRSCALAMLACAASFGPSRAAWDPDGNRVSFFAGSVIEHTAIPFGQGGVLMFWSYQDPGSNVAGIQAQVLDGDGNMLPGWGLDDLAPGTLRSPLAIGLGEDDARVVWLEHAGGTASIHIQRLLGGTLAPGWPVGGRMVVSAALVEQLALASDAAGGVYLAWNQAPPPRAPDFRLLRLGADGAPAAGWPAGGLVLAAPQASWYLALAEDGAGGVYTAWSEPAVPNVSSGAIRVRRFTSAGTPNPAWPVSGAAFGQGPAQPGLVPDGAFGLYATWKPLVLCPVYGCIGCYCPSPLIATHLDGNGAPVTGWPASGMEFGDNVVVSPDAAGGLLVGTTSGSRGLAARLRPDGTPAPGWSLAGNPVCSERRQQTSPSLLADGSGGAFASWIDYRTFEPVLYVSRLTPSGSIADGWPETGSIGSVAAVGPASPMLLPGRTGQALVVWTDSRSGSAQLYAEPARPGPAGPPAPRVGLGFTVTDIRPNPARGAFWATVSLPELGIATLELFDLAGRVLESRKLAGGRPGVVQMNVAGDLAPGVYWLRLRQGSLPSGMRTSLARVAVMR